MLHTTLKDELKTAMKAKEATKVTVIRDILAGVTNQLVADKRTPQDTPEDELILKVIKSKAKQRKDSIEQFEAAGRTDLSETEKVELAILETYLPEGMSEAEIKQIVSEQIAATGATSKADLGKLMGAVMGAIKQSGKDADGKLVQKAVLEVLN